MLLLANALVVHGDPEVPPRLADVLVDGERIAAVGDPGSVTAPAGSRRIDLTGHTLLPGLIDLHVHLTLTGEPGAAHEWASMSKDQWLLLAAGHAQQHLAAGVTTIRDLGGWEDVVFPVRDAIRDGLIDGPRVHAAGLVVTRSDGHGNWLGAHADDAAAMRRAVAGRIAAGADCIKIVATGGVHTPGSDLMAAQYTEAELRAGIEVAHAAGLRVGSHASNPTGMANATRAGVDSIEHGVLMDDAAAALMAEHGTTFVPTLAATHLYEPHANHPSIPDYVREKAAITVPAHRENFPRAVRRGVRMATGTDAGSTFVGHGLAATEVELLARYGLSPLEAIAAGTRNAAAVLGLGDEIGAVAPGMVADVLVVAGDASSDVAALHHVALVVKGGRVVRGGLAAGPEQAAGRAS